MKTKIKKSFEMKGITQEERWIRGLRAVWQAIGNEILSDEMGKPDMSKSIKRSDVFELAADCYFETHSNLEKADIEAFRKRDRKKDSELRKKAFPFKWYGW